MCFCKTLKSSFKYKLYSKWPFKNTNLLWKEVSKIATENIIVYKVGYNSRNFFISYIQSFIYTHDKLEYVKPCISIYSHNGLIDIRLHQGFHVFKKASLVGYDETSYFYPRLDMCYYTQGKDSLCLAKFIIPKGARYIEDDNNEIVSDAILFHKIIV